MIACCVACVSVRMVFTAMCVLVFTVASSASPLSLKPLISTKQSISNHVVRSCNLGTSLELDVVEKVPYELVVLALPLVLKHYGVVWRSHNGDALRHGVTMGQRIVNFNIIISVVALCGALVFVKLFVRIVACSLDVGYTFQNVMGQLDIVVLEFSKICRHF